MRTTNRGAWLGAAIVGLFVGAVGSAQPPGPPSPGQVLPAPLRESLRLTPAQVMRADELQELVDTRLEKLLTPEQWKRLQELRALAGVPPAARVRPAAGPDSDTDPPKPRAVAYSEHAVREAVAKALPVLWKGVEGHTDNRTCVTCHNHAVPLLAVATARDRGFAVSEKALAGQVEFITDHLAGMRDRLRQGSGPGPSPIGGGTDTTGYILLAFDAVGKAPDANTTAVVEYTLRVASDRDHWGGSGNRPPTEASPFSTTYNAIRGLRRYGQSEQQERIEKRIAAARGWLLKTPAKDTEDRVFRLLGLKAAGAADEEVAKATKELLGTQRADGGWGQLDAMDSDPYATGTALVALHQAGGVATDDPAYRRGLVFLLGTQLDDGSWHVRTRSRPIQQYFESGFPHKRDQFISCAATGWATTALALSCPVRK